MREHFQAFFPKDENSFKDLWQVAEFTFDANVLLDLYGTSPAFNETFFEVLAALEGRLFLTHQAAWEFYRNRRQIIEKARDVGELFGGYLESLPSAFSKEAKTRLEKLLEAERASLDSFLKQDPVESAIESVFKNRLEPGTELNRNLYSEIDARYERLIPPGFADATAKESYKKYGDAVLWLEIIEHAKRAKNAIILITSEKKPDWWLHEGRKIIGPRPELATEMYQKAGVDFHLYSFEAFMKHAPNHLRVANPEPPQQSVREIARLEQAREIPVLVNPFISGIQVGEYTSPSFWAPPVSGALVNAIYSAGNPIYASANQGYLPWVGNNNVTDSNIRRLLKLALQNPALDAQTQNEILQIERNLALNGTIAPFYMSTMPLEEAPDNWESAEIPEPEEAEGPPIDSPVLEASQSQSPPNGSEDDES